MPMSLIDIRDMEIKIGTYRVGSASQLIDPTLQAQAQDYKRQTGSRMIPLDRIEIASRIPTAVYWASRKLDGEFTLAIFRNGQAILLNPGGTVRTGLPITDELAKLLGSKQVSSAILVGELHSAFTERRERIHDVIRYARGPESQTDLAALHFGVFDILELDQDRDWTDFGKTWNKIEQLFSSGAKVRPVPTVIVRNSGEIESQYVKLVEKTGAEGLVLRSNTAGLFKIKPRRTLDAVVIGFTESIADRTGLLHDLLLAVRRADGTFHVLCRVGGGFSDELRRSLLSDLKDFIVESEYAEVNSDHEAYQMVRPKLIVEISCLDLISQSTRGAAIQRMTLDWDAQANRYRIVRRLPLVSVISPQFIRFREDKTIAYQDIRIDQVSQVVEVPLVDKDAKQMKLPPSQLLQREVFTKVLKGETMVRKFVMWKTNKDSVSADYPAFVIHFTDFSPNRAQPLAREVRVSNSADQIQMLYAELKEENIKKGWSIVGDQHLNPETDSSLTQVAATDESARADFNQGKSSQADSKLEETKAPGKRAAKTTSTKRGAKPSAGDSQDKKSKMPRAAPKKSAPKSKKDEP